VTAGATRKRAISALKRGLILEAARRVFESEGLEGASLRGIAAEAGYTPAALYFHFESKAALYAEVLAQSLAALKRRVDAAVAASRTPAARLRAAALAFFDFYADQPRDLDLGFYLFRGGMRPHGLGRERDRILNAALEAGLLPIADAARGLGATRPQARLLMAELFAYASGLLLLLHTRRIRMFGASPRALMKRRIARETARLTEKGGRRHVPD
jgi:AcrR family transcriptional regulator